MKRTTYLTHNVCRSFEALLSLIALILGFVPGAWAKPPYQVIAYVYQTTDAPTNSVNDNGQGANINWTTGVPWNDITMINDAFFQPNTDDTFSNGGEKGTALINAAHAQGERCNAAIGGGGQDGAFSTLCEAANREAFASAVTALIMQYGYDGVEIDWETVTNQQADATDMMEDIYRDVKALPDSSVDGNPRTLSFTTNPAYSGIYDMTTLANYTDWCFFMGYDWYDTPDTYANGPLGGVNPDISGSIEGMTNGSQWSYPASKMILGCPLYTDDYNAGTEIDTLSILHLGTAGAYNTSYAEQAYTAPDGDTVYVDAAQSYCDKINWALGQGLKGIGMWDLAQALPYTDSAVTQIWNTIGGNASCLNLGPTATPTITATPVVASSWRVVAGGPAHTDCQGNVWAADENYVGGTPATSTNTITGALPCTSDQALYQDQRYGSPFSYVFNVPSGDYQVTLKFAETYFTAKNDRIFGVSINGTSELSGFDIYNVTGGENIAIDKVFNNIEMPSGGAITISFAATTNNALVDSLQIIPQPATATPTPTSTKTATSTSTLTFTTTATPTWTSTSTSTPTLTVTHTSSPTLTWTNSSTPTASSTSSMTLTVSATSSSTWTGTETSTSTMSLTPTTTPTGTLTPVNTPTSTLTLTRTDTPTQTLTSTLSSTATTTPTGTYTAIRTSTSTLTQTNTPIGTFTSTMTHTATPAHTATATVTESDTPTPTSTLTPSPTASWTSTSTLTETRTPTLAWTSTATVQATWTRTPTPTLTATWTATRTPTPLSSDTPIGCSGIPDWNGNFVAYSVGAKVDYDGVIYECIQSHTSEANWEPPVVPALWKDLGPCGSTPEEEVIGTPVAYPNPATSSTIQIELPMTDAVNVKVKIYTVAMREVQSLDMAQVMGNTISMELKDKSGINLADGLYYFVIQAQGQKWINKVLVLR